MVLFIAHFSSIYQFSFQGVELQSPDHVSELVKRAVVTCKGAANFAFGIRSFMAYSIDEEVDALLWRPFAEMVIERENNACAAVHAPEKHADTVFRRLRKFQIPQ